MIKIETNDEYILEIPDPDTDLKDIKKFFEPTHHRECCDVCGDARVPKVCDGCSKDFFELIDSIMLLKHNIWFGDHSRIDNARYINSNEFNFDKTICQCINCKDCTCGSKKIDDNCYCVGDVCNCGRFDCTDYVGICKTNTCNFYEPNLLNHCKKLTKFDHMNYWMEGKKIIRLCNYNWELWDRAHAFCADCYKKLMITYKCENCNRNMKQCTFCKLINWEDNLHLSCNNK